MIASKKFTKVLSILTLVFNFYHLSGQNLAACIHSFHLLVQYTRMGGGGVNCRQSARIQHPAFSCDLAFSHMLHMPVSPPNSRFQAFSPQLTHLHRKKGEEGMLLLHYTKQLGKFGFLHTCSPVTELLAKTPFYSSRSLTSFTHIK